MKRFLIVLCVFALSIGLSRSTLLGDITVDVEDVTTPAGATVLVDIFSTSTMGESLLGLDIPLDIGGDGVGVAPAGLTLTNVTTPFQFNTDVSGGPLEDVLVGGSTFGPSLSLPTAVATLEFTVDGSVAAGTVFEINILNTSSLTATDQNFGFSTPNAVNGSITVVDADSTAVPEPGSFVALGTICVVGSLRRRRR